MSQTFDDSNHPVRFISPLEGDLVVRSMSGEESLGRLFFFNLELLSYNFELHFHQIVGHKVTVVLDMPDESERYFNGYITEFRFMGQSDRFARYTATVRPWLWFLSRTADCRIFPPELTAPDIIKQVFRDNGISDYEDRLGGDYRPWEYCVQYRESDFNFVSRLMENEGIYYFFEHHEDSHILVLADDISAHEDHQNFPDFDTIPYFPPSGEMSVEQRDHIEYWATTQSIQPDAYYIKDFDFKKPRVDLGSAYMEISEHPYLIEDPEIFDYPGEYTELEHGTNYVERRLEELRCQHERVQGGGPCRGLSPGCLFTLEDHPREDQNKEYLVISMSHQINGSTYISTDSHAEELYRCQIEVMDKFTQFRSARETPKPIVQGPQTAIVVGPDDEEIYTDSYGRVKVQFHWDRYGESDENSSCWIRVSQVWAGAKWGAMHIPRIGQEVIVSFIEGDPDRPIITGRVYNDDNMPPYDLEGNKTQSGIKSRSTKGGTDQNFNEIRMEDKKGEEELYIHAEKNHTNITENDRNESVGHDRSTGVENDYSLNVGNNAKVDVGYTSGQGSYTFNVKKDRTEKVTTGDYSLTVETGKRTLFVKSDDKVEVKGDRLVKCDNTTTQECKDLMLKGSATIKAQSPDINIAGATKTTIGPAEVEVNGSTININGGTINLSGTAINLTVGGSHVKISSGGVDIKGGMVKINT